MRKRNSLPPPAREARMQNRGEAGFLRMAAGHSRDAGKRVRASSPAPEQSRTSRNGCPAFFMRKRNSLPPPAREARMQNRGEAGFLRMAAGHSRDAGKRVRASSPAPKRKATAKAVAFRFVFRPPEAASTLRYFKCSAEVNSACAEVLPSKTLVRRKGAAGQKAG